MIPAKNYIQRRTNLAKLAQKPLIVISGSELVQKSSDATYEFAQDGHFYYLTGINEPGWVLVMDVKRGEEFLISTDESSYHSDVWEAKTTHDEITKISGISDIRTRRDGWAFLRKEVENYQSIGSIVPHMRYSRPFGMYLNPAKTMLVERLKRLHKDANLIDISASIRTLRSVKEPEEIADIKKAAAITKQGFDHVTSKLGDYTNEAEIQTDLTYIFMSNGSKHGYEPIVASGAAATTLHYTRNNQQIQSGQFLLMDIGAEFEQYSADITRTYAVGDVSQRHKDVYAAVQEAHNESMNFLKAGVTMRDHERHMEQFIGKKLNELGMIDNMLRNSIRAFFPHSMSHHLGIDVHDSCDYEAPLQEGAVITVEPGIYSKEEGIGVRIEDDVLIKKDSVEILTKGIGVI